MEREEDLPALIYEARPPPSSCSLPHSPPSPPPPCPAPEPMRHSQKLQGGSRPTGQAGAGSEPGLELLPVLVLVPVLVLLHLQPTLAQVDPPALALAGALQAQAQALLVPGQRKLQLVRCVKWTLGSNPGKA